MPTKLELALCISKGNLIDIFDIHSGVHIRSLQIPVNQVSVLHDSFLACNEVNKPVLSIHNYRFNRVKWKCVIPKETLLGPMAIHFSQCSNDNNNYKSLGSDPRYLCVGTNSGHIYTWCLLTGQLLKIFKAHLQKINCLVFTPDGNCLISSSDDCLIKVWKFSHILLSSVNYDTSEESTNAGMGSIEPYLTWKDHVMPVTDIICGTSGPSGCPRIFTCSLDCSVKIYSLLPLVQSKSSTGEKQSSVNSNNNSMDLMSANSTHLMQSIQFPHPLTSLACDTAMNFLLVASRHGELYRINLIDFPLGAQSIQHIIDSDRKTVLADVTYRTTEHDSMDMKSNNNSEKSNGDGVTTPKTSRTQELVSINDICLSYDGRMAITAHSDGTACVWDVLFGTKVRVLNKHRKKYDKVICVCDRLGSYATHGTASNNRASLADPNLSPDIKYEKFSLYSKNWPLPFKRYYETDQFRDITHLINKHQQDNGKNKYPLILPPKEMSIYLPGGMVSASELGVTWEQRTNDTLSGKNEHLRKNERYGENSWWSDQAFLERIENEFSFLQNRDTWLEANSQEFKNTTNIGVCKELLEENKKLKSEIEKWKELHQSLYKFTCQKVLDLDQ